ncbi:MAG: hypothetical protein WC312_01865 [Candidatus Omnitrophota bacterium]|jgi:chromosome segregation ATPase
MDKTLRSILWILVGLVVLSSFSTAWFFLSKEKLYNEYTNLEELFKTTMDKLNTELTMATNEKAELNSKLRTIEEKFNILEASHSNLKSEHETVAGERDSLKRELASARKGRAFLEKRLKEMESDIFVATMLNQKAGLEAEIDKLKNDVIAKEQEISGLKTENKDKDLKLAKLEEDKASASWKLTSENNILRSRVSEFEKIAKEYNNILTEKENMNSRIARLESNLEHKNMEIDRFKTAVKESAARFQEARAEAYHAPEEVDLPPIVAQKTARLTTPSLERIGEDPGLKGRVVTVNKEHNFVVIDLGKQDGIEIGNMFNVYRGLALLGSVEIIQARDRIAAADIKNLKDGMDIEINDTVVKR